MADAYRTLARVADTCADPGIAGPVESGAVVADAADSYAARADAAVDARAS
ncbi:hypothetical protein [Nocardia sp. NPDC059195]|uniref:hypothetical protein n=1 Tax=Nocardia sp. NPDC059195 TaxID=3346765 RepID=UPI0036A4959B